MSNGSNDEYYPVLNAFEEIEKPMVAEEIIAEFEHEDDFTGLGMSLLIEAGRRYTDMRFSLPRVQQQIWIWV